jgi:hypothetical protein
MTWRPFSVSTSSCAGFIALLILIEIIYPLNSIVKAYLLGNIDR